VWRRLASGELASIERAAAAIDPADVAAVARLRRSHSAGEVRAALQLAEGRRRLAGKVDDPDRWLADSDGAQMATHRLVAAHKASRFAAVGGGTPVVDVCSGIGADAHELARLCDVRCVEIDPCRAVMCGHNTGCVVEQRDAAEIDVGGSLAHIDPARRGGSGRVTRLADLVPGPAVIGWLVRESEGSCVKLMPGIDRADLDEAFAGVGGELEHVSLFGRMTQAAWWTGVLAGDGPGSRATMIGAGWAESIAGEPEPAEGYGEVLEWLFATDPAAERAGLLSELARSVGADEVHPGLGLLTSTGRLESPWLTGFRVLDRLPWRVDRVREAVASHGGGVVEVKTRGGAVDPDRAQLELRGPGERTLTVFVLRFGTKIEAIIAERA
jgi:hypothetical protein